MLLYKCKAFGFSYFPAFHQMSRFGAEAQVLAVSWWQFVGGGPRNQKWCSCPG